MKFARHRWVLDRESSDIEIAQCARPRAELSDWADEQSRHPIDPERGPGWRLSVLPLTDGSTAVSVVHSHYLVDGLGITLTLADAALGRTPELALPPPRSRTRRRAIAQDARQTARDLPEVARAVAAVAKQARRRRHIARPPVSRPVAVLGGAGDDTIVVPTATICVNLDDWDARAKALGGASSTLVAGWTAKLAEHLGRRRAHDGAVTMQLPISDRVDGDTRANAMSFVTISVDPTLVTTDLREVRASFKHALQNLPADDSLQFLRLASFVTKRAWKRMFDRMPADPDVSLLCSNLGDVDPAICRLDGTDSALVMARVTNQYERRQWLEQVGGQMIAQSWRIRDAIRISVTAYQPGAENTKPALRELAARTLADFDLTAEID